ncbi:MAG: ThiF family adenylyltransferase [Bryobacteraceae bacterium]|nr:ThiF family adenylyltransferase [Bryobacteraceae bacterium]
MTPGERERYSRQIRFAGIGEAGQERLLRSRVAIVGCGALGSFQAGAMARSGVGHLTLIDRDFVELSNLQRQWLYGEADAREAVPKAAAAAREIARFASDCHVTAATEDLTPGNIDDLLGDADIVLDGTDNFETRFLVNDYCIRQNVPWIYGAAVGSYGLTFAVMPQETPCLACLYPAPPGGVQPTCETAGVLSPITSTIASLQCAAALRILAGGAPEPLVTTVDVWTGRIRQVRQPERDPECRACAHHDYIWLNTQRRVPVSLCGRNAVQIHERNRPLNLKELRESLEPLGEVRANDFAVRFFVTPYEMTIFPDGRAIIKGTQDIGVARSLYARYIGA